MDPESIAPQPVEIVKNPFGSVTKECEFIKAERQPVDYTRVVSPDTQVLAIGEIHTESSHRDEVTNQLAQFKDLGFTHLAMETWGDDSQQLIDQYQTGVIGRDQLEEYAKKSAKFMYIDMIEAATKAGIKVIGIDLTQEERAKYNLLNDEEHQNRDRKMARIVVDTLEADKQNKVVTFTGGMHAGRNSRAMAGMIAEKGVNIVTMGFFSGRGPEIINTSINQAGFQNERFMIPSRAKFPDSSDPYDWIANIPPNPDDIYLPFDDMEDPVLENF